MGLIRRDRWNTYRTAPYQYDVSRGENPWSTGNVHFWQVKCYRGKWQTRTLQVNGIHSATSEPLDIPAEDGELLFQSAEDWYMKN